MTRRGGTSGAASSPRGQREGIDAQGGAGIGRLSALEYHALLALATEPLYGYAIKKAIVRDSQAAIRPGAGSLYRLLARLMADGLVEQCPQPVSEETHPGLERRYYQLTALGRRRLIRESERLERVAALAIRRLDPVEEEIP